MFLGKKLLLLNGPFSKSAIEKPFVSAPMTTLINLARSTPPCAGLITKPCRANPNTPRLTGRHQIGANRRRPDPPRRTCGTRKLSGQALAFFSLWLTGEQTEKK